MLEEKLEAILGKIKAFLVKRPLLILSISTAIEKEWHTKAVAKIKEKRGNK